MAFNWLKKISSTIEKKKDSLFTYPVEKQIKYIKKLGTPKDELERSYFQYRCQMKFYGGFLYFLLNCAALPLSLVYLAKFKRNKVDFVEERQAIFFNNGMSKNIIPQSLHEKYDILPVSGDKNYLDRDGKLFLKKLFKRYPFSWMLWLKAIVKVSCYGAAIKQYSPSVIICRDEFSFTSSLMTRYCRDNGIKLINVMHGEKLYYMRDSFVEYDEYYVWDSYYADLLIELGAQKEQFVVEVPESLKISVDKYGGGKAYDYTYYLALQSKSVLQKIASCMRELQKNGYAVSVRPHPRYSDMVAVNELFEGINIEDCKDVTIEESVLRTKHAISLYSTVLNQACNNGVEVVIDDITDIEKYKKLKSLKYFMLSEERTLLSQIIKV